MLPETAVNNFLHCIGRESVKTGVRKQKRLLRERNRERSRWTGRGSIHGRTDGEVDRVWEKAAEYRRPVQTEREDRGQRTERERQRDAGNNDESALADRNHIESMQARQTKRLWSQKKKKVIALPGSARRAWAGAREGWS